MKLQKETIAITALLATGALSLPVLTSGFLAGQLLGLGISSLIISITAIIIGTLAGISAHTGSAFTQNTIALAKQHFGHIGIIMVSIALAIALTGWFAIQIIFICDTAKSLLPIIPTALCIIGIGGLLTLTRMLELTHLGKIAAGLSIPLAIIIGLIVIHLPSHHTSINATLANSILAIGGLLGTTITATLELPILYESTKLPKQAMLSSIGVFGLLIPLIQLIGATIGARSGTDADIIKTLVTSIPGGNNVVATLIICSGIIANLLNLFSSSESLTSIFPKLGRKRSIIVAGSAGTLLALLPITNNLLSFFSLLTVSAGSLALIMVHTYIMKLRNQSRRILQPKQALVIWLSASAAGIISQILETTHPLINPLITTLVITSALIALQIKTPIKQRIS